MRQPMALHNLTRRALLEMGGLGLGAVAFAVLEAGSPAARGAPRRRDAHRAGPSEAARPPATNVIMLMENGGPSQVDLFDPKPELARCHGKVHSERVEMFQKGSESNTLLASPMRFRKNGQCGMEMAEILPALSSQADDLCMIRSMYNYHNNHTESLVAFNTGKIFPGRPTLGSWVSYALGTDNENLPAYIVLRDPAGYNTSGSLLWQNGFLPAVHRGTEINTQGSPVLNLQPSWPRRPDVERENLRLLGRLNEEHRRRYPAESALEARIHNYELAARMQLEANEILDLSRESAATQRMYGLHEPKTAGYGTRCLMARRLVEQGVRFVQVFPPAKPSSQPWDAHKNVKTENEAICSVCDQPSAALIRDLKQRGLLESTIVLWSGEFGRLPVSQNGTGRDHNRNAFSLLLAGGGFQQGFVFGATDEVGYRAVENRVSVADLHATLLHQMGLDHEQLSYQVLGRPETLTDAPVTGARVVRQVIAT